jgi:hypothetical protein
MARIIGDGSAAQAVRYSYSGAATHIAAAVQQRWDAASGIWVDLRKVEYSYFASSANGMDGDLEKATRYVLNDAGA